MATTVSIPRCRAVRAATAAWALLVGCASSYAQVLISEFAADNDGAFRTLAGDAADWIELHNPTSDSVDLGGWYLTDKASTPAKWRFPDGTQLASNGYLVVFADSAAVALTNGELHASFSLSKDGEYLGLVRPDGTTVEDDFAPAFPEQFEGVAYGRAARETVLIGEGAPARYRVPDAGGAAPWQAAAGALGFAGTNAAFTVRHYEMNAAIANINAAETMAATPSYWKTDRAYPVTGLYDTIDFHESANAGHFTLNRPFPGLNPGENKSYYVAVCESAFHVPQAGLWTFCVGSDDGFRLRLSGHGVSFSSEFPNGRGFGDTLASFNFPTAGVYSLSLVYFENTGGATLEFSAAPGFHSAFDAEVFRLVGDPAGGLLHAGAVGAFVETDVGDVMRGVNARLDAEWAFSLPEAPDPDDTFTLALRAADGFRATVNGVDVGALNLPEPLLWNSAATAARPPEEALAWIERPVAAGLLAAGSNTLAITALNDDAADGEFLIQPRLVRRTAARFPAYFKTPTPGAPNGTAYTAPTPKVVASEPRGYKTEPFAVTLACPEAPEAAIRYTLDGSAPHAGSPLYTMPIEIAQTTLLRAAVVDPLSVRMRVTTVSWLFLDDILQQGATPPAGWPASQQVNNHVMEYGLRPEIVSGDPARLREGLTNAIPTISLVTDLAHLFDPQTGIYVNPGNDGTGWERPVSVELIDPVRGPDAEFRIDAGLRIRGAFSRSINNPKHSFRLFFRSEYGESRLNFRLFGDEGADTFQKVDLRTSQNYSWAYQNSASETFVREVFSRDAQRDMGMPYTRSRFYHLMLNGQYWGLYQTQERGDADYAETYLGGDADDWDCIKTSHPGYVTTAADGTFDAFHALHDISVNQGYAGAHSNNYWRVRGLNPDGSANPAYPVYLDEDNLIVCMLSAYYTGDPDSPVSIWGGFPNNMYALFNRSAPSGFKWLRHDAEHSLGAHGGYPVTCDTTTAGSSFTEQARFNPATLHQRLCEHPDYRMRFADLAYRHLYGDGALTPARAQARFQGRMQEIDLAVVAESARWGRGKTRDGTWLPACASVLDTYLTQRRDLIAGHFRNRGWLPSLAAPALSTNSAAVPHGYALRLQGGDAFYYTLDGSDPRLPGGGINPAATLVTQAVHSGASPVSLVGRGAVWRYHDLGFEPADSGGASWKEPSFPDGAWPQGPAVLGFAGSATVNPVATVTRRYTNGVSGAQVTATYLRHAFTLDSTNGVTGLSVEILRDDGAVVYLNGVEILRENMPAGAIGYAAWSSTTVGSPGQNTYYARACPAAALRPGPNVLAVELHQCNATSSDLYFDLAVTTETAASAPLAVAELAVTNALLARARAFDGAAWSPLAAADLTVLRPPVDYAPLRVTELMHAPPAPASGGPYVNDDYAWLELRNTGAAALDLAGVRFAAGLTHTFEPLALAPGARLVLAKNPAAFAERHATNGVTLLAWTGGNLARKGETLSLTDPDGTNILTFTYSNDWYPETTDTGRALVAVDTAASEALWSTPANWRPSRAPLGSPGWPDAPAFAGVAFAGAETLTLSAVGLDGDVELWHSDDLSVWTRCPDEVWLRDGDTLAVDLLAPALPPAPRRFFQLRLRD